MLHAVELEADQAPVFPDRCVVCGRPNPEDGAEMVAPFNAMQPLDAELFALHRATVPACTRCKPRLKRSRWLGKLLFGLAVVVATLLVLALVELQLELTVGWVGYVVLAVVVFGPFLISMLIYTPYFDFAPWDRRVVYDRVSDNE